MSEKVYQIAVIGDSFVGKTSLLRSYFDEKFSEYHLTNLCDNDITDIILDKSSYKVKLIDTAGQISFENSDADCFVMCYSIENRLSFANMRNKWINLIKSSPKWPVPFVVAATKVDLRDELPGVPFLTSADGRALCEDINGKKFIETSARDDLNTKNAIEAALKTAIPALVRPSTPNLSKAKPKIVVTSDEKSSSGWCGCCQS